MEAMVRYHLKETNVQTTTVNPEGIESELGLAALLNLPESEAVYGPELTFELRQLYSSPFGANLRNDVAHGLLADGENQSLLAVFAWWLLLRMVVVPFWNRMQAELPPSASDVAARKDS